MQSEPKPDLPPPEPNSQVEPDAKNPAFTDCARVKMNFNPIGSSWYGDVVGGITDFGLHVAGFDDGELRFFPHQKADGLKETGLLIESSKGGGLIDNQRVVDGAQRAECPRLRSSAY
eukprot:1231550-Pleurochrysis_carterae.AAC.2